MMGKYDVVIIGSGLGGLICGNVLSREGYSVCIIEKNRQIGGSLQTFVRDKCIIDTGVHYVGGLGEGQNLYKIFNYLGFMDKLKLKRLDEDCFDMISFDGDETEYKFAQGYDEYLETMAQYFPGERNALKEYCNKLIEICRDFPMYNLSAENIDKINMKHLNVSVTDYLSNLTPNRNLQNVLAGSNMLYAGVAGKTPVFIHALIMNSYIQGSWKFIDGSSQLSKYLAMNIRQHGGTIVRNTKAERLVFENNSLKYLDLSTGERIEGKYFISNVHPAATVAMIGEGRLRKAYKNRINSIESTISSFNLYIIFKKDTFKYLNYNRYHFKLDDVWHAVDYTEQSWPESYLFCTPASSKSPHFAESGVVVCYMKYDELKQWEQTHNIVPQQEDRGEDYEKFKVEKSERVLDELEKKYPGIRGCIKAYYSSTPLTYRDYIGNHDGSLYGNLREADNPMKSFIPSRTKIPNLLLTGQNVHMSHGVLGVTIGALLTCAEFVGARYLVEKMERA